MAPVACPATHFDLRIRFLRIRSQSGLPALSPESLERRHGRRGTSLARLYSIAVDPAARGRGIAAALVRAAVKAAGLIGNGLYGVDVKQCGERVVVIEVNDNPNLDAGVEDQYLGDELYRIVLEEFVRRMERRRSG